MTDEGAGGSQGSAASTRPSRSKVAGPGSRRSPKRDDDDDSVVNTVIEFVVIIAIALGLALLIQAFVVKPYRIPSGSMLPTLKINQRVLVSRLSHRFGSPHVGQIVVFNPPEGADQQLCGSPRPVTDQPCDQEIKKKSSVNYIKRIVAGPGDRISIVNGHVVRNGKLQKESFTNPCGDGTGCNLRKPITIPPDHYFMMGDNRGESDDSRFWGPVPKKWIIGPAFFTYWPPKHIGLL